MGVLNNPKWELFAREAAKGEKGATAYKAAGYTATDKAAASNAYKLLQRADWWQETMRDKGLPEIRAPREFPFATCGTLASGSPQSCGYPSSHPPKNHHNKRGCGRDS